MVIRQGFGQSALAWAEWPGGSVSVCFGRCRPQDSDSDYMIMEQLQNYVH